MIEIKSVRVRIEDTYELDFKVTLYRVNNNKRKIIASSMTISEMDFAIRYRNYSDDSIIEEYLKTLSKLNHLSTNYKIIQDPWSDDVPIKRTYGFDPYYLNNGAKIYVKWLDGPLLIGGDKWSDSNGRELNETEFGETKYKITKIVQILSDSEEEILILNEYNKISKLYEEEPLQFSAVTTSDEDIIKSVISIWKSKVPNYNLDLCEPNNEYCNTIEYISPIEDVYNSVIEEEVIAEDNKKEKLSVVLPTDIKVKVKEDISIQIFVGNPPAENLPGFIFGDEFEEDLNLLDEEYIPGEFQGNEVQLIDGEYIVVFENEELYRDEATPGVELGDVETGGNDINSPNSSVNNSVVNVPNDLKKIDSERRLSRQSMSDGLRPIRSFDKFKASQIIKNMNQFINDVLGPFSTFLKKNYPSLYRDTIINSASRGYIPKGGSKNSMHFSGQAVDIRIKDATVSKPDRNVDLLNAILKWYQVNPVGYDQILFETGKHTSWIHWGYSRSRSRLQLMRFENHKRTKTLSNGKYVLPTLTKSKLGF